MTRAIAILLGIVCAASAAWTEAPAAPAGETLFSSYVPLNVTLEGGPFRIEGLVWSW